MVPDLTCVRVTDAQQVLALLKKGNRNREVRHTEMNQNSSRSHSILQLYVEQHLRPDEGGNGARGAPQVSARWLTMRGGLALLL